MTEIVEIDYTFDINNASDSVSYILPSIRPDWALEKVITEKLTAQGLMNLKWTCQEADRKDDIIIFRIFEIANVVDHDMEYQMLEYVNDAGACMQIYAKYNNGYAYKYADGNVLTAKQLVDPDVYKLIIDKFHKLHQVDISPIRDRITDSYVLAMNNLVHAFLENTSLDTDDRYTSHFPARDVLVKEKEFALKLHTELKKKYPLVVSHSDAHTLNVIYDPHQHEINLVDWDAITMSYEPFEIGVHWERDGVYGFEEYGIDIFADEKFQREWLTYFLQTHPGFKNTYINEEIIQSWLKDILKSAYLSSCVIMMLAMAQIYGDPERFDYWRYAKYLVKKTRRLKSLISEEPVSGCDPWVQQD